MRRLLLLISIPAVVLPAILHMAAADVSQATWSVSVSGNELQIAFGSDADFPQYGALHLNDGYFRLNYGPVSNWGTSVTLMPSFWSGGIYHQGAPISATWRVDGIHLRLWITGTIVLTHTPGSLLAASEIRLAPPTPNVSITAWATTTTTISGHVALDNDRPGEAFKPMTLSSMHLSPQVWDAHIAHAGSLTATLPASGWIFQPSIMANAFGLQGGTSCSKTNAPTLEIELDRPMHVTGWVTPSNDPRDDNVGFWAALDSIPSAWSFEIRAIAEPALRLCCVRIPVVLKNHAPLF